MKPVQQDITIQLWDYVEGKCAPDEAVRIQELLVTDANWQQEYKTISLLHKNLLSDTEAEQPSMRFTKNIMEALETESVAKPAKKYVNPVFVKSIAAFFIILLTVVIGYTLSLVNWNDKTASSIDSFAAKLPPLSNGVMLNAFIMANIILLLILLDRLLNRNRIRGHHL